MWLSACASCGQQVYFENVSCTHCGAILGFVPSKLRIQSFVAEGDSELVPINAKPPEVRYRRCANWTTYNVCNWVIPQDDTNDLCVSCRLNRTIPNLSEANNDQLWLALESEKRRLIYGLLSLKLPVISSDPEVQQLTFDFLADTEPTFSESGRVFTGHANGVITLNIKEANPVVREQMRLKMAEPYRTLLGHFRHESGHYYWDLLVRDSKWLEPVRALFGDDTQDYSAALQRHYEQGAPVDWQATHISAYASMHPWEDWAETWAHYLHIIDTLETAKAFGLILQPGVANNESANSEDALIALDINPYANNDFAKIIKHWLPLSYALNSLSRSMGHQHLYPFVLAEPVVKKLDLINRIVHNQVAN